MEKTLISACKNNQINVIKMLSVMMPGANFNKIDDSGKTALSYCAQNGNLDAAMILVALGADVNWADNNKNTPLHLAAASKNKELLKYLLSFGVDINCQNEKGETPLFIAVLNKNKDMAEIFIQFNAKDLKNNEGKTAFDIASENGMADEVRLIFNGLKNF